MKSFFKIEGIGHDRYVGIAKADGKAYNFYILNIDGYRPATTEKEIEDCRRAGLEYYQECHVTGKFDLSEITPNKAQAEAETEAKLILDQEYAY